MKKKIHIYLVICIIIFLSGNIFSMTWEFGMRVVNANGQPIEKYIRLYQLSDLINDFRNANSTSPDWKDQGNQVNFYCDVGDDNTINPSWDPIEPTEISA